jgi:hypothetical protein
MESWLSVLAEGVFESPIAKLVLRSRDGQRYEGSGHIKWTSTEGVRLYAETEVIRASDDDGLLPAGGPWYSPGKVVSHKDLLTLEGHTPDNWQLIGDYVTNTSHMYDMISNQFKWDVPIWTMKLYRPVDSDAVSYFCVFIKPVRVLLNNPQSSAIAFSTSFGQVSITRGDQALCCISIATQTLSCDELEDASDSVCLAIAFIEGRAVAPVGYDAVAQGFAYRKVYGSCRHRASSRSQPLPASMFSLQNPAALLQKASEFFNTKRGKEYSDSLRMCWDCVDCYGSIQAVTSCAMLENLIGLAETDMQADKSHGNPEVTASKKKQLTMEQQMLLDHLEKNRKEYGDELVDRVNGMFTSSHDAEPGKVLQRWCGNGILGVDQDDVKAWGKLRHSVAHGNLVFNDPHSTAKTQKSHDRQRRVNNLINKIIMHAMDYKGMYFDHAKGHPSETR